MDKINICFRYSILFFLNKSHKINKIKNKNQKWMAWKGFKKV